VRVQPSTEVFPGRWRRADDLAVVESPTRAVVVRLSSPADAPRILEGPAADIWHLVDGSRGTDEIVRLIGEAYAVTPHDVVADVHDFLDHLSAEGLVVADA